MKENVGGEASSRSDEYGAIEALTSPRQWLFERKLKPRELATASAIIQWTLKGWCWYSAKELAERTGWGRATVERAIAGLIKKGIAERNGGRGKKGIRIPDRSINAEGLEAAETPSMVREATLRTDGTDPSMVMETTLNGDGATREPKTKPKTQPRTKRRLAPDGATPLIPPDIKWSKVSNKLEMTEQWKQWLHEHLRKLAVQEGLRMLDDRQLQKSWGKLNGQLIARPYLRAPKSLPAFVANWFENDMRSAAEFSRGRRETVHTRSMQNAREVMLEVANE